MINQRTTPKRMLLLTTALLTGLLGASSSFGAGWYDVTWVYRKPITIHAAQVAGNLTNFPVLIQLAGDTDLANNARSNGFDILFTASDGTTKLDHEIEKFTYATGALTAWVEVPSLSSTTDTIIYMYYGNPSAANQQNVSGTWSSNYGAVWHLNETAAPYADSSGNANNSTAGTYPTSTAGKVTTAQTFNGTTQYIQVAAAPSIELTNNGTISAWFQFSQLKQADLLEKGGNKGYTLWQDSNKIWLGPQNQPNANWATTVMTFTTGQWYKIDGVINNGTMQLYINGALNASSSGTYSFSNTGALKIGDGTDGFLNGILDEMRIANVPRSAQWIATEYNNQNSPGTFYATGTQVQVPSVAFTSGSQNAAESAGAITITAQLSAAAIYDVSVPFTVGGTASNPADYSITASPLTITAGTTTATITINIVNDFVDEPNETVVVTMGTPVGATKGATTVHTATILDDDVAGINVSKTTTNVTEGGATDSYTLVLNSEPTANIVITVTPDTQSDVGAGSGTARQFTFTSANWNVAQAVTVTATDDPDVEGPHSSTITQTAASADPYYNGIAVATVTANITDNDTAGVTISKAAVNVTEGGATDTYTVVLHSRPTANVTVTITPDGQLSVGAGAGIAQQLTFTYANWNVLQTVTVTATDNPDIDGPRVSTITQTAASADANYSGISVASVTANITDNDTAGVTISKATTNVTEGGATDTYTVVLHSRPTADVVVTITPDNQLSIGSGGGIARQLTFTYASWNVAQMITVTAVDDAIAEGSRTATITHTAASTDANYNGIAVASVTANITDDDIAYVNFSLAAQSAVELPGTMTVDVTIPMVSTNNVIVPFTLSGTAANPADYTITPSPVTIPAGQLSATVTITIIDNFINNPDKTVILTMGNPTNGVKGTVTVHTATILDNEPPGVTLNESGGSTSVTEGGATDSYTLVLQSQPLADVDIAIATDGKTTVNPASITFTAGNWNVPQTITVTAVNDAVAEGVHSSVISHALTSGDPDYNGMVIGNVTATITDNDTAGITVTESGGTTAVTEGGATDTYDVVLHSQPTANVTITISTDGKTTTNSTLLTFTAANWSTPQTVTVTAVDDAVAEGNHTSTITHAAASGDPNYNGIAIGSITANITDNDTPGLVITESGTSTDVTEGGATDTYTVTLHSQPTSNVTVTITSSASTTVNPASLTFTPATWNAAQVVTVTAVNDAIAEGSRTSTITHAATSADPNYNGIAGATITANVTDNDTAAVTVSKAAVDVTEGGVTDTYTIVLNSQPTASVVVTITPDAQSSVGAGPGIARQLTFTAGNWNAPQVVTVTATDDPDVEGPHTSTITHSAASADPNYNGIAVGDVTANITDNDTAAVTVSKATANVTEGGATDTYTLVLNSRPTNSVTVTITPDAYTTVNPASATFTAGNWNVAQTVTVTAVNDAIIEGLHTSTITHTAASVDANYNAIAVASVTANITDNDIAYVNFSLAAQSAQETAGTMTVDVTIPMVSTNNVIVPFTLSGTAATPANYTITPSPVTIPAGQLSATITITIIDDLVHNPNRTVILTMGNPTNSAKGTVTVHTATILDNEPPGITLNESGGSTSVTEGGATDNYTLVLQSQPLADVDIAIATDGKTTVSPTAITFTAGNWNAPQTITVTAVDDAVAEGAHSSTITHTVTSGDPDYNGMTIADVTATITDNDTAGVTVTESDGTTAVTEGGATDIYNVVLNSQPTADVTISVSTDGKTTVNPTLLTFTAANWNTPQTVTVTAVNDAVAEGPHTSTITHAAASPDPNYSGIAVASVTVGITDNDAAGVSVVQSGGTTNVAEGIATDTYSVVLTSEPTANVTIAVSTDADLTVDHNTLTFTPLNWNVPQTITVTAVDDNVAEGPRTSTITHTAASPDPNYNAIAVAAVTVNITDNDTAAVVVTESGGSTDVTEGGATDAYDVVLTSSPTANVTFTISTDGKATVTPTSLVFTPANWSTPRTVTVTAVDDPDIEGPHTSTISHTASSADPNYNSIAIAAVTANITDNDTAGVVITESGLSTNVVEGGAADTYTVVLHSRPTSNVTVTISSDANSTVVGPGGLQQLTFTSGNWNVPQTVTVTAVDDGVAEGLHTSTITHTAASADANYNGIAVAGVTANITDNDIAYVNFSLAAQSALETAGTMTVNVTLSCVSSHDVTVPFALGGTAATPANYTITPSPVTIPAGQLSATITITIIDDFVHNTDRTVILTMGNPTNGTKGTVTVHTATILDDEPPGITLNESGGSTTVTEGGATDSYTLVLRSQPLADANIAISTDGKTTVSPASVTFTAGNWNVPQTITVTAVDDSVAEGVHSSTITHTATSGDADYNGMAVSNVIATITDNDTPGVVIAESGSSTDVAEGGTSDTYTVVLHSQPTGAVTVSIATDGKTTVNPASLSFTVANWNVPQTVTVTAVDDAVAEGLHTSTIAHAATSADSNYNGIAIANVTANITDNDTAGLVISESNASTNVTEGGTTDAYTIALHSQPTANVTVTITPDAQTTVSPTSLTFTPGNWNIARTVTVTAVDDAVAEGLHASTITHTAASADPNYNGLAAPSVTANITDNDTAGVTVSKATVNVTEGSATDTYTVVLHSQPISDVTVTITPDAQTTVNPTSLAFTAATWNAPRTVTVTAVDDTIAEGSHTSTITHATASIDPNYNAIAVPNVTANITDNDIAYVNFKSAQQSVWEYSGSATVVVTIPMACTHDVIVPFITSGTAIQPEHYVIAPSPVTIPAGQLSAAIPITIVDTRGHSPDRTIILDIGNPINGTKGTVTRCTIMVIRSDTPGVNIMQSDGSTDVVEGGQTDTYGMALTSRPTADVVIAIQTDGKTTVSPTSLTFKPGDWNIPQAVTVAAPDDQIVQGSHTSTISHTSTSIDPRYNGIAIPGVTVSIMDTDVLEAGITVSPTSGLVTTESGGTASFTVVLRSKPAADVRIPLRSSNPAEGAVSPQSITFTAENWNVPQNVTVRGMDDPLQDGDVRFVIFTDPAVSVDPNYSGMKADDVSVTNKDNDTAGITISAPGSLIVDPGQTSTFTIVLNSRPAADVTIGLHVSDPAQGTISPSSVTFTSANWNVPQTISVTRFDGLITGNDPSFAVVMDPAVSVDPNYNGAASDEVPVTDDRPKNVGRVLIRRIVQHGVCGPLGYVPLLFAIPGLLGAKAQRRGRPKRGPNR